MPIRRSGRSGLVLAVVLLFGLCPRAVFAGDALVSVESRAELPLRGAAVWFPDPCRLTPDAIPLTGTLQVHTVVTVSADAARLPTIDRVVLHLLAGRGMGLTGQEYQVRGTARLTPPTAGAAPWRMPLSVVFDFLTEAASACRRGTVVVRGELRFDPNGHLNLAPCTDTLVCTHVGFHSYGLAEEPLEYGGR